MANPTALSMKLLIDRKAQRVLFAEASKDVVDFLFSLLAMPVATAVKLIGKDAVVGSVGNLYASVEKLDATYVQVQPGTAKDTLLRPTVLSTAATAGTSSLLCLPPAPKQPAGQPKTFYRCSYNDDKTRIWEVESEEDNRYSSSGCPTYVTDGSGAICPKCGSQMTSVMQYVPPPAGSGSSTHQKAENATAAGGAKGFVQSIVMYTVMDNLTVTPMSTISGITMLNTFAVRDLADLQEKTVQLGYNEGLAILKASLQSKTVLTVFLGDKKAAPLRA